LELEDVAEEELDVGGPGVHDDVEDLLLLNFPAGRIASCGIYIYCAMCCCGISWPE
jgi:hypothetical protein